MKHFFKWGHGTLIYHFLRIAEIYDNIILRQYFLEKYAIAKKLLLRLK